MLSGKLLNIWASSVKHNFEIYRDRASICVLVAARPGSGERDVTSCHFIGHMSSVLCFYLVSYSSNVLRLLSVDVLCRIIQ